MIPFPVCHWSAGGMARGENNQFGQRLSGLDGAVDGRKGTFAFWGKLEETVIVYFGINASGSVTMRFDVLLAATGKSIVLLNTIDGGGTGALVQRQGVDGTHFAALNAWAWYGWSWDLDVPRVTMYLNDTDVGGATQILKTGDIGYSAPKHVIWGHFINLGDKIKGCVAHGFMSFDTEYDFNQEAERRKFISASGGPVTVPAGGIIDLPDGYPDQNKGSGGAFSLPNGPFVTCATAP